jgi:hypothetical protein
MSVPNIYCRDAGEIASGLLGVARKVAYACRWEDGLHGDGADRRLYAVEAKAHIETLLRGALAASDSEFMRETKLQECLVELEGIFAKCELPPEARVTL